jgi:hypothetical protein
VLVEPFDVPAGRAHGRAGRPRGRGLLRLAARRPQGRATRQRARGVGDEPPHDPGPRGRRRVLRRPLRLDDRDLRRGRGRGDHVPPARLRRRRARQPVSREVVATMSPPTVAARRAGVSTSGTATSTRRPPRPWSSAAAPWRRRSTRR